MPTANQKYFSAALRRQVDVRRFTAGEVKAILKILETADAELVTKLRERLARLGQVTDFTSKRYQAMLSDLRDLRSATIAELKAKTSRDLVSLGQQEAKAEEALLRHAIPIDVSFSAVSVEAIRAIVTEKPFRGHLLNEWFTGLKQSDQRALTREIQLGMTQGEGIDGIVRRVAGTKANKFADGALAITRRNAEAVVRTGVSHVSNATREAMWDANADIMAGLVWVSTLDGRTTLICEGRDGQVAPIGDKPLPEGADPLDPPEARPPAHVNCRSTMVGIIDGQGLVGNRPFVQSADRPEQREADFRAQARETGRPIQEIRAEWAAEHIGQIPSKTTYSEWLGQQPADFQDEVLGAKRGALFRQGDLELSQFTDRQGNELTLEQLAARHPTAFEKANIHA